MISVRSIRVIFFLIVSISYLNGYSQKFILSDSDVEFFFYNRNTDSVIKSNYSELKLDTIEYFVREGDRLHSILEKQGFLYDGEILSLLLDMNPCLDSMEWRSIGKLTIPSIRKYEKVDSLTSNGYYVAVTNYPVLKRQIADSVSALNQIIVRIQGSGDFLTSSEKETLNKLQETTDVFRKLIKSRIQPLNKELLENYQSELSAISPILEHIAIFKRITENENAIIKSSCDAIEIMVNGIGKFEKDIDNKSFRIPKVCIEVSVANDTLSSEKLRVYYVYRARLNAREKYYNSFDKLSPPVVNKFIPIGIYYIWAGKPGDITPLTELHKLEVTGDSNKISVDLVLINK